jgi:putative two-component system response regulator
MRGLPATLRRTEDPEPTRLQTLQRWAVAAELREDDTGEHTRRVARIASLSARAPRVPDDAVERLGPAASLPGVGGIAVPDAVLLTPGRLTGAGAPGRPASRARR